MIKIRLEGLPKELNEALETVRENFDILSESDPYKNNRSKYYRIYLDVAEKSQNDI